MENIKKYGKHVCWIVMVLAAAYLLWSLYRFHILPLKYYIPILVAVSYTHLDVYKRQVWSLSDEDAADLGRDRAACKKSYLFFYRQYPA